MNQYDVWCDADCAMEISDLEKLVNHGARLLDQRKPDWFVGLDISTLNMHDNAHCVLGLLYGDFYTGVLMLNGSSDEAYFVCSHGFDGDAEQVMNYNPDSDFWSDLTSLWDEAIVDRQENRVPV